MHVVTQRALSFRSPRMISSYSVMLFVHLSDSSAKLRCVSYLYLAPDGVVMTAAAPAHQMLGPPTRGRVGPNTQVGEELRCTTNCSILLCVSRPCTV
jgi:hypothetical protein